MLDFLYILMGMFTHILNIGSIFTRDTVVLLGVFVLFFAFALYFGKNRIISLLLSFYPAAFLYERFPYLAKLLVLQGPQLAVLNKLIIFLIFLIPIDIIINKFIFSDSGYGSTRLLRIAGFAIAGVILMLVFTYSVVDLSIFYSFSIAIHHTISTYIFWWTLAPLILMFFL